MLTIHKLQKKFKKKQALYPLDLHIEPNQCVGIIGRNGAGKTTLLRLLSGLLQADKGTISYNNIPFEGKNKRELKRDIGIVLDDTLLIQEFSGLEQLYLTGTLYKVPSQEIKTRIDSLVNFFFENPDDARKRISSYSTGMKKKIMLGAALIHRPNYLLLDEPLTGLDPFSAKKVIELVQQYAKAQTILISSHDLSFLEQCCHQIVVIDEGRLLFQGTVQDFTDQGQKILEESLYQMLLPKEIEMNDLNWLI